jgi:hypothetical protein
MSEPLLILSGATTGLPRGSYKPRLLEAAAVLLVPGGAGGLTVGGPANGRWSSLIYQPPAILGATEAQPAKRIHGIKDHEILAAPSEHAAAEAFGVWLADVRAKLASINMPLRTWHVWSTSFWLPYFDQPPWNKHPNAPLWPLSLGLDAMEWSSGALVTLKCNTKTKAGHPRKMGLKRAFGGFQRATPGLDWNLGGAGGRALPQACRVAQMVVLSAQVELPAPPTPKADAFYAFDPYGGGY